jgi:hypothetical protein
MKIQKYTDNDFDSLVKFNSKIFPGRDEVAESLSYRLNKNPVGKILPNEVLIARNKADELIGQLLLIPTQFYHNGTKYPAYWDIDFYVEEPYRGLTGVLLAKKASQINNLFGVGYTEHSFKLRLTLGEALVGSLTKYLKICSPFVLLDYLRNDSNQSLKRVSFPEQINLPRGIFKRVRNADEIISPHGYWNMDYVEFIRDKEYIEWRFFTYENKYAVYTLETKESPQNKLPVYFVVRHIKWKNLNCLLLVDYRFDIHNKPVFGEILKAATKIARKAGINVLMAGTSVPDLEQQMKSNLFFKFGSKLDILSRFFKNLGNNTPNNIILTFADSDCDGHYMNNNKW